MIKILLEDYPDRHRVGRDVMPGHVAAPASEGIFHTSITHNGEDDPDKCWELEVRWHCGPFSIFIPKLSRQEVSTRDMLYELMLYDDNDANNWVRTLLPEDLDGLWERYLEDHPPWKKESEPHLDHKGRLTT